MSVPFEPGGQRRTWERLRGPIERLYPGMAASIDGVLASSGNHRHEVRTFGAGNR